MPNRYTEYTGSDRALLSTATRKSERLSLPTKRLSALLGQGHIRLRRQTAAHLVQKSQSLRDGQLNIFQVQLTNVLLLLLELTNAFCH